MFRTDVMRNRTKVTVLVAGLANTDSGLWPLDAETATPLLGGPINSASVNGGNGRGIDVDPASQPTANAVYTGADCDPGMRPTAAAFRQILRPNQ